MGSVIKKIQLEELAGKNQKNYLQVRSVGGLSLVGVTPYFQAHWLKLWPLFPNKHWMAKTRETVDENTDRDATASKPRIARDYNPLTDTNSGKSE